MIKETGLERYLLWAEQRIGKKIYAFLRQTEQDSIYDFSEDSPYSESILSQEVKWYFRKLAAGEGMDNIPEERDAEKETNHAMEEKDEKAVLLQRMYSAFQLDAFEQMCVELAVLGEINPYFEKFFIYMNNDWNYGCLTLDTVIRLYTMEQRTEVSFYRYFSSEGNPLSYFLKLDEQERKGRGRWGLKCRKHFFQFLMTEGEVSLEDFSFLKWCPADGRIGNCFGKSAVFSQIDAAVNKDFSVIYLQGEKDCGKTRMVEWYGRKNGHAVCFLDIERLAYLMEKNALDYSLQEICQDISLQVVAGNAWLCLHSVDSELWEKEANRQVVFALIDGLKHRDSVLFITGEACPGLAGQRPEIWEIPLDAQEAAGDVSVWEEIAAEYALEENIGLPFFASTYRFTPAQIERIFINAEKCRYLKNREKICREDIKESCIKEAGGSGNHFVTITDTGYRWEELVLPEKQKKQLRAACSRVLYKAQIYDTWGFGRKVAYGRGVSMVFAGPPGTGKTMSAGIIADCLGTTLYRVDLAAVVSKYIGETEKNLSMVFETAKKGQGVLFFDEADVLFSRRTEVNNSNDRHSNMETAYLLQKMEEYEGVVILATNYMQNMDEAFKRRIQFLIEFPFPDEKSRKILWEKVFPEETEFDGIPDYDFLARQFELTGSHIKNIALQAAFFAAEEKKGVGMEHIIRALLLETRKTGKRISREDLREYYIYYE